MIKSIVVFEVVLFVRLDLSNTCSFTFFEGDADRVAVASCVLIPRIDVGRPLKSMDGLKFSVSPASPTVFFVMIAVVVLLVVEIFVGVGTLVGVGMCVGFGVSVGIAVGAAVGVFVAAGLVLALPCVADARI